MSLKIESPNFMMYKLGRQKRNIEIGAQFGLIYPSAYRRLSANGKKFKLYSMISMGYTTSPANT
jgi:hypothetical protein